MRTPRKYARIEFPPHTKEQLAELEELRNMRDEDIDFSDIPPLAEERTKGFHFYYEQPVQKAQKPMAETAATE